MRLARRLEAAAIIALRANVAIAALFPAAKVRERLSDDDFTPSGELSKPVLIITADDNGRTGPSGSPIRALSLSITARMNAKLAEGDADSGDAIAAAIEAYLDTTNHKAALTAASAGSASEHKLAVMLARRTPGVQIGYEGLIRTHGYRLECQGVALEHTVAS